MLMLTSRSVVVGAAIKSLKEEDNILLFRLEQLRQKIYALDAMVSGDLLRFASMEEYLDQRILGRQPYRLLTRDGKIGLVPLSVKFWLNGCTEPETYGSALYYLHNQTSPIYGFKWPPPHSALLFAYSTRKHIAGEHLTDVAVSYTTKLESAGLISRDKAENQIDCTESKIKVALEEARKRLRKQ